jgi:murein DD-endopeptidase MepM/ murein hydrolase activator NlpD
MKWSSALLLAALVSSIPAAASAAPAQQQAQPKPKQTQQAASTRTRGQANPGATNTGATNPGAITPKNNTTARPGAAARPVAARSARLVAARGGGRLAATPAMARAHTPHPGLGGDGSEAARFCGGMIMPAESLREVSRGMSRGHAGLDLMAPHGSPIRAAAAGTVIYAGWYYAYGNMVDIRHADGVVTRYAHMSALGADVGSTVQAGDEIGKVGATGRASGPHIHFEVRVDGRALDPKPFLALASCNGTPAQEEILEAFASDPPRSTKPVRRTAARPQQTRR